MNSISTKDLLPFSGMELKNAEHILEKFGSRRFSSEDYYYNVVFKKEYDGSTDDISFRKLKHLECIFSNIKFDGTDGTSSLLVDCSLKGCQFNNAGFNMSDFTQTRFEPSEKNTQILNSSFVDSNFMECSFQKVGAEGCSFQISTFEDVIINNCNFNCCNFENAKFKNTFFKDADLTAACIDFSEFDNARIHNTKFSYWGILWSYGGLQIVKKYQETVKLGLPNSDEFINGIDFLNQLEQIQAHFYYKKDYFSLANINIFLGNQEKAFLYVRDGLLYNLQIKNFRMIKYLCKLASNNHFFSKKQLSQLYYALQSNEFLKSMTSFEYKIYMNEMNDIKKLLVDNPFGQPQIVIRISTNIGDDEYGLLTELLGYLEQVMARVTVQSNHYITIRHNSPFSLELFNSDNLVNLYSLLAALVIGIWGCIPQINDLLSAFINIKKIQSNDTDLTKKIKENELQLKKEELKSQQITNDLLLLDKERKQDEIQTQKLENELLKLEIEKLHKELNSLMDTPEDGKAIGDMLQNNIVVLPTQIQERIVNISYSTHTEQPLPYNLRENSIQNNKI